MAWITSVYLLINLQFCNWINKNNNLLMKIMSFSTERECMKLFKKSKKLNFFKPRLFIWFLVSGSSYLIFFEKFAKIAYLSLEIQERSIHEIFKDFEIIQLVFILLNLIKDIIEVILLNKLLLFSYSLEIKSHIILVKV